MFEESCSRVGFENVDYVDPAQNAGESAIGQSRTRSRSHSEQGRSVEHAQDAGESALGIDPDRQVWCFVGRGIRLKNILKRERGASETVF